MKPRDLRNTLITGNSCTSMGKHGTKTISVFLPADEEASRSLLPSWVSLRTGGTVQPETRIPVSSRWQVKSEKVKKESAATLITASISVHLS